MCGSDTLAMEMSITSMNVAMVTVSATAHGLCPGCQPCASSGMLLDPDLRLHRHARPQPVQPALAFLKSNPHRQPLHYLDEISRRVLRRQQARHCAARRRHALYVPVEIN